MDGWRFSPPRFPGQPDTAPGRPVSPLTLLSTTGLPRRQQRPQAPPSTAASPAVPLAALCLPHRELTAAPTAAVAGNPATLSPVSLAQHRASRRDDIIFHSSDSVFLVIESHRPRPRTTRLSLLTSTRRWHYHTRNVPSHDNHTTLTASIMN